MENYHGKKICVAVSGGADSTALLYYMHARKEAENYRLFAVHCEHGIRGEESLADEAFVKNICKNLGVQLFSFREDCPKRARKNKQSLETAAREFRRECFATLVENGEVDLIATAHHQDDEAETVLFRIARGASLSGARGMDAQDGYFIRPFLHWSKKEILAYIQTHGLKYCEDKTNFERDATRNKIRLDILPALEEAVPGAKSSLARFARLAGEDDAFLYELSASLLKNTKKGWLIAFSNRKPLFSRACLTALKALGVERDYTSQHLQSLFDLQNLGMNACIHLPKSVVARKTKDGITLSLRTEKDEKSELPFLLVPFAEGGFDGGRYEVSVDKTPPTVMDEGYKTLRLDLDKIPSDAFFRLRKDGDKMRTFGSGTKSLKKLFNERKIPVEERAWLPILAGEDGEVYAVCGVEICEKIKVTENTVNTLYIHIKKK